MDNKNEREREEQSRKERIKLDKVKQGVTPNFYAQDKKKEKPLKPVTFAEKWKNFWYHYKGVVAVTLALVVVAAYFVHDVVTKPKYDALITVATTKTLSLYQEIFEKDFNAYAQDYDNDGKVNVGAALVVLRKKGSPDEKNEYIIANKAKLTGIISASEHILFLLDDVGYTHITDVKSDAFMNLSEKYPGNKNVKGDRFYLKGTKYYKYLLDNGVDAADLPEDISLCIRDTDTLSADLREKYAKTYENQLKLAFAIIDGD